MWTRRRGKGARMFFFLWGEAHWQEKTQPELRLPMETKTRKWKWKSLLCLTLCDPLGVLQARTLEWVVVPFSGESSQPRDWTQVSHIAGGFFTVWAAREPKNTWVGSLSLLQGIFLTQELNWGLLHWKRILYRVITKTRVPSIFRSTTPSCGIATHHVITATPHYNQMRWARGKSEHHNSQSAGEYFCNKDIHML